MHDAFGPGVVLFFFCFFCFERMGFPPFFFSSLACMDV